MVACGREYLSCAPKPCHRDPVSDFHLARKEIVLKAGTVHFQMAAVWGRDANVSVGSRFPKEGREGKKPLESWG